MPSLSFAVCIYCGSRNNMTMDHVPPKLFLARPYPAGLITVPCCEQCNRSFQRDDEYTRTVISLDVRAAGNTDIQSILPSVIRSLERPNARGFLEYLKGQTNHTIVLDENSVPMGSVTEMDKSRVNATGARIVRALHYIETGRALSPAAIVRTAAKAGLRAHDEDMLEIARVYSRFKERRHREIGNAFSYAACFAPNISVWLILLYDYFAWIGTVADRARV